MVTIGELILDVVGFDGLCIECTVMGLLCTAHCRLFTLICLLLLWVGVPLVRALYVLEFVFELTSFLVVWFALDVLFITCYVCLGLLLVWVLLGFDLMSYYFTLCCLFFGFVVLKRFGFGFCSVVLAVICLW